MARQYCGQLGKQDNCQVAVSLSVATHQGSLFVAYRLYLPKEWAAGNRGVPDDVCFQTKPEIALQQAAPGAGGWRAAGPGAEGSGLRQQWQTTCLDQRTWADLRGRHPAHHDGLTAWRSVVPAGDGRERR